MLIIESIVLGIIQGLAEFIPISSSAHLIIVPWLFGWDNPALTSLTFDVALHLGTLLAVIVFFAPDWARLISAWFKSVIQFKIGDDPDRRMAWYILLACIPGGISGLLLESKINEAFHSDPIPRSSMLFMAGSIALLALLLWTADKYARHQRNFSQIKARDALCIGLAQAFAVIPGVSRSGSTITAGLALGLEREAAARFSFLLSAPIIAGAGLKSLYDFSEQIAAGTIAKSELSIFPIGFIAAAVSGFFCIKYLLSYLKKHSTNVFVWYRFALAALVVVVSSIRA
ncbi:MAG TPA: undecaprenyl-diphosphatase UppP [Rectinema sp.]|jgi:undecaprenyl-diphosphatase|nr:undecaprenyl-diphosphatase UppP [Rectinema sp.]HOM92557.1 undecaprenyl-diphosphatase UppP [Rectinema sp.]HOR48510.1 undecaprenyl-diphosphatase UppP [Rectinema sp.]HOU06923.1 undecaprenyl-diphosphatase UppP [Rectinema sp.]HPL71311.1 undecaprenyl-diphosphatase UppP [Rectinema sp.]